MLLVFLIGVKVIFLISRKNDYVKIIIKLCENYAIACFKVLLHNMFRV